ncbi:MAG: riboflavin synthase [Nitrospirota bacterium]|nr:riboflavin synthase [Nitrospirota bacterium]
MFTGIVEELGSVRRAAETPGGRTLEIACATLLEGGKIGDSIMVNGACLTVTRMEEGGVFSADVSTETLRVTTLGGLRTGSAVNLERAMALGGRLGGHLVSGHVDAVGHVRSVRPVGEAVEIWFDVPSTVLDLTVVKGSLAVEGVSLTVNALDAGGCSVMIIPHTAANTTLLKIRPGGGVNLEADLIGKYVARLLGGYREETGAVGGISEATLHLL